MKAKAMVLEQFNQPLVQREFELSRLPEGALLVKILASGVCGSDLHMAEGEDPRTPLPIILGHEGVGEIVQIDGKKKDLNGEELNSGDWIIWNRGIVCNECFWCKVARQPYLCPNRKTYGINLSCRDYPHLLGAYAEYMVLFKETEILKIPKSIDPANLVLAGCSGATAMHGFDVLSEPLLGKTVVVQGAGPLGVFCVVAAKSLGASTVVMISGTKQRLELAMEAGADMVLNRHESSSEERIAILKTLTHNRGADVVIEASGSSNALIEGFNLLRRGGTYLVTGVAVPQQAIPVDVYKDLVFKNIDLKGIWVSDARHLIQAVELVIRHEKVFEKLVTHRLPLEKANEALRLVEERQALKVVLTCQ
ncbi:zinc-binding dehydrogenase [Pseudothermotoga sp. U03pept]|uniref:zinc-binding dehydrogenase n=1 Tax=Pseudothermotoga sp. U03pept TaxID=3447012 RepID=UPI003F027B88